MHTHVQAHPLDPCPSQCGDAFGGPGDGVELMTKQKQGYAYIRP